MAYKSKHTGEQIDSGIDKALDMDNSIKQAVDAEATIRTQAIAKEVTDRNAAIQSAIDTEVTNRNSAIKSAIDKEASDRDAAIKEAIDGLDISGGGSSGGGTSGGGTSGGGESYITLTATASSRVDLDAITTAGTYRIMGDIDYVDNMPAYSVPERFKSENGVVLRVAEGVNNQGTTICTQELIIPTCESYFLRVKRTSFMKWLSPVIAQRKDEFSTIDEGVYLDCTQGLTTTNHGITVNAGDKFDQITRLSGTTTHQVLFHYPTSGAMNIYIRSNVGSNTNYRKVITQ
jgi:hypothetical protein